MWIPSAAPDAMTTPAREMTAEAMEADFEYRMAEKLTLGLLEKGLITPDECTRIQALNRQKFYPFYAELY